MKRTLGLGVLVVVVGVLAAVSSGGVLAATYDISFVDGLETPTETVEYGSSEYEIDEIGVIEPGETLEVDVTSSTDGNVLLYNTDGQSEAEIDTVNGRIEIGPDGDFDTSVLDPGTYMLALWSRDDGRQAVAPVVVQGHDVSLASPSTVEAGNEVTFEATVEPYDGQDQPDEVELAIWDDDERTEVVLEQTGGTDYENTTSVESLDLGAGTYDVYGAVFGDETVEGYPTALAAADGGTLTVTEGDGDGDSDDKMDTGNDGTDDGEDGTGGLPGGGSDGDADADSNESVDDGAEETDSDGNEAPTDGDESDDQNATDDEDGGEDGGDDAGADVIEPNESDENETAADTDDTGSGDGLGTSAAIAGLIAIACFLAVTVRISS